MSDRSITSGVIPISAASSASAAASRSTAITRAPSSCSRQATARPIPLAAPVTTAVRPVKVSADPGTPLVSDCDVMRVSIMSRLGSGYV